MSWSAVLRILDLGLLSAGMHLLMGHVESLLDVWLDFAADESTLLLC